MVKLMYYHSSIRQKSIILLLVISWIEVTNGAGTCNPACKSGKKCVAQNCILDVQCPEHIKYGSGPPKSCSKKPSDPLKKPKSKLEEWFTKEMFDDLFPKANIGWGPSDCWPYSYESFKIAARYFPDFGTEHNSKNGFSAEENYRRDLATFFAHAVQETGENDANLYKTMPNVKQAHACFYRGGFFNWFEGGPQSAFIPGGGLTPAQGDKCSTNAKYCSVGAPDIAYAYPCGKSDAACYFGRGAIQISYNYNYGMFQHWLKEEHNLNVDLLNQPNLVMTKMDPPLGVMASLWFYMTPQPPKPAMHDIILGNWEPGDQNRKAGYGGAVFGPTSLIINNECGGEDKSEPGGAGESRRIKAFKWFCQYFNVPYVKKGKNQKKTLSCKNMPVQLNKIEHEMSYQPDWSSTWKEEPCQCQPAKYAGLIPYFPEVFYPPKFNRMNAKNKKRCEDLLQENSEALSLPKNTECLQFSNKKKKGGGGGGKKKPSKKDKKKNKQKKQGKKAKHWG